VDSAEAGRNLRPIERIHLTSREEFFSKVRLVTEKNAHCYGNAAKIPTKSEFSRFERHVLRLAIAVAVALSVCQDLVGHLAGLIGEHHQVCRV
jgi:hypothetical protein